MIDLIDETSVAVDAVTENTLSNKCVNQRRDREKPLTRLYQLVRLLMFINEGSIFVATATNVN